MFLKYGRLNINTQSYWNDIWGGEDPVENRNNPEYFNFIVNLVPAKSKVLDVGCGSGYLLKRLHEEKQCHPVGLDISNKAIESIRLMGFEGKVSKLPMIPFPDSSFDVVICTDVLEHISNPRKTIKQIARIAKTEGLIIVRTPDDTLLPIDEPEHLNAFTESSLKALLEPYLEIAGVEKAQYTSEGEKLSPFLVVYGYKVK